jgi:hypothetical protein
MEIDPPPFTPESPKHTFVRLLKKERKKERLIDIDIDIDKIR